MVGICLVKTMQLLSIVLGKDSLLEREGRGFPVNLY